MNEEKLNMLKSSQAQKSLTAKKTTAKQKSPKEELATYRVTPETKLSPLEFLFKFFDTDCFPLSELVADTGKAKSGKTLFLSIVMACALKKNVLGLERISPDPIRVLWYDTEQSAQSTQQILVKRIMPLAEVEGNIDDRFFVFNVRGIGWEKRRELLAVAIEEYKPNLVILDGTKDLLTDINDGMQATVVVEDLMGLAQAYNCCIVNVLHQNKSDQDRNMRGWIGTELTNKAFEVWSCSIVPNTDTFKVEHVMSRMKRSDENLYYKLDENLLPCCCEKPDEQPREPNGRFASKKKAADGEERQKNPVYKVDMAKLNRDYICQSDDEENANLSDPEKVPWDLVKLFTDAMEGYSFKYFNQLMATAMSISNIEDKKYYYHLLDDAKQQHIIAPGKDANNRQCFFLNPPETRLSIIATEEQRRKEELAKQAEPSLPFTESDEPVPY
ncbi:MAG: AAA family ATPase [Prevotella sp.]|nr:AAA family ATPase [Prevotella sp.]